METILWAVGYAVLMGALCLPLVKPKHTLVALAYPIIFITVELCCINWMLHGWTTINVVVTLLAAVFIGLVLLAQLFGRREWYLFYGGGFVLAREIYEDLAETIRNFLWLTGLAPASVIFRSDGFIGFSEMGDAEMEDLMDEIDKALKDSHWSRRGPWHWFFGIQYGFMVAMLVIHVIIQFI